MWSSLVSRLLLHTHNTYHEGPFLCACTLFISDLSHEGIAGSYISSTIGMYQINHTYFLINVSRAGFEPGIYDFLLLEFAVTHKHTQPPLLY